MTSNRLCRFCRLNRSVLSSIYSKNMTAVIRQTLEIEVPHEQDVTLSTHICSVCKAKLFEFLAFRIQCRESDLYFKRVEHEVQTARGEKSELCLPLMTKEELEEEYLNEEFWTETLPISVKYEQCHTQEYPEVPIERNCQQPQENMTTDPVPQAATPLPSFSCDMCDRAYFSKETLRHHKRVHNEEPLVCPTCGSSFKYLASYSYHVNNVHSDLRRYACPICEKRYKKKDTMEQHVASHKTDRPFECKVCKSAFKRNRDLQYHMRTHNEREPIQCPQCPSQFWTNSGLRNHLPVHTGERKFGCSVCGKAFRAKTTLQKHMHSHTRTKPHQCSLCEKGFFDKIQLKHHLEKVHTTVNFMVQILPTVN